VQAANEIASAQPSSPTTRYINQSQPTDPMSADKNLSSSSSSHTSESHEGSDAGLDETTPLLLDQDIPQPAGGHGHSHSGSMNMRALVLHVLGDALGNVGVIASGLIIWLTTWSYKYYSDPVISLVITVIIFSSALPLGEITNFLQGSILTNGVVHSTSFILLQGVPHTVSLNQVRRSILGVEGVLSLHELHIWQLSESKIVASVHVLVASRKHEFMLIAANIRRILHQHGVHSSTIQSEYRHEAGEDEHSGAQPKVT